MPQLPNQRPTYQKEANILNQRPVAQKGPPQRQLVDNTDNTNSAPIVSLPVNDNPIPVRHFEPNPLLEVPQPDKEPQEVTSQHPVIVQEILMLYKTHLILKWKPFLQKILLNQSFRDQR